MDYETILIVIAAVLVVAIGWFIGTLNRLRKYRVIIEESQKNVDIALRFAKCLKLRSRLQNTKKQH